MQRNKLILLMAPLCAAMPLKAVDFVRDVRPILEAHCTDCHGSDKQKSSLRLDIREAALRGGEYHLPNIVPGNPDASNLIRFVRGDDEEMHMPPKGEKLSAEQIATLVAWVKQGAVWPEGIDKAKLDDKRDHWSFKPLAKFDPSRSIDAFVTEKLAENELSPSPEADRLTWLRRVSFDLTGLPPSPEQVQAFLNDSEMDAYAQVVDALLASPRYGERWAQHWLDVVRYADTHGFEVNTPRPNAWPYRDYVINAFNEDTPYNQFIREQLAGDRLGKDAGTGFLVTAARLLPGQIGKDAESMRLARQDELGEIVINTSEAFLGLSIGCARCHNHKFDAISAKDYYAMQAFFAGVSYGDRVMQNPETKSQRDEATQIDARLREIEHTLAGFIGLAKSGVERAPVNAVLNIERFAPAKARKVRFTIKRSNMYEPCIDELEVFDAAGQNVALASRGTTQSASGSNVEVNRHQPEFINDGEFGNSRSWMCSQQTGWVMLEFPQEQTIERIAWGRDREGKFADRLALEYVIEVADDAGTWQVVADSTDRIKSEQGEGTDLAGIAEEHLAEAKRLQEEKKALEERLKAVNAKQLVFGGAFTKPEKMFVLHRGDPEQPEDEVGPAVPEALGTVALSTTSPESDRRLALADWIAQPEHPLTARVMVNRIWQGHFGIGLVETANDFGRVGASPSHPALLDWLASEFIQSGWSMKHMHRRIVLSATYRQSSLVHAAGQAKDADVRLLWRFPARRLEGESLRDSMLSVSGRLNLKTGGPGFDMFKSRGGLSGFPPIESFSGDGLRRMIYAHKIRMEPDAVFGAFDCPDAGQSVSRRRQSTTPIQALNLFNSVFTFEESQAFAKRIEAQYASNISQQITSAYRLAYGREPAEDELADAEFVVREHGLETLCRVLYNSNEFLFIP